MTKYTTNIQTHRDAEVQIIDHAKEVRWAERTDSNDPGSLRAAWRQSIRVWSPEVNGEMVRLYAPQDLLLVKRDGVVRTVLHADYTRLEIGGFTRCEHCGNLMNPLEGNDCPWCDNPLTADGPVISLGGGGSL